MLALTLTSLATLPFLALAQDYGGYGPVAPASTASPVVASPVAASPVAAAPAATQTVVVGTSPACSSCRVLDRTWDDADWSLVPSQEEERSSTPPRASSCPSEARSSSSSRSSTTQSRRVKALRCLVRSFPEASTVDSCLLPTTRSYPSLRTR